VDRPTKVIEPPAATTPDAKERARAGPERRGSRPMEMEGEGPPRKVEKP
jgi:hypothetical protein